MNNPSHFDSANGEGRRPRSWLLCAAALGVALVGLALILASQSRLELIFEEFEMRQSALASFALSRFPPVVLVFVILTTVAAEFAANNARLKNRVHGVTLALSLLCIGAYAAGVFDPLLQLLRSL